MATVVNKGMPPVELDRHIPTARKAGPAVKAFAITPSDAVNLTTPVRAVKATGAGNVALVHFDGSVSTVPIAANEILEVEAIRVNATNTTATGLIGLA